MDIETFLRAFRDGAGTCCGECACGKTYYQGMDTSWGWDDGELEKLEKDPDSYCVDYAPGYITFEGRTFIDACDCWHARAKMIIGFIDGHAEKIANYLNAEADRKLAEAQRAPTVKTF